MSGFNRVVLMGNLTREPRVRQLPSGTTVGDLSLAASDVRKNRDGESVETVCFVDIVAWGRQAETCGEYLRKGSPVLVEGRLQLDRWEADDGQKRSKLRVRADRVKFLGRPASAGEAAGDETSGRAGPEPDGVDDDMPF